MNPSQNLFIQPDVRRKRVTVTVEAQQRTSVSLAIVDTPYSAEGTSGETIVIDFPEFEPWTPEHPRCYALECRLQQKESHTVPFGMRDVTVQNNRFSLNAGLFHLRAVRYCPEPGIDTAHMQGELETLRNAGVNTIIVDLTRTPSELPELCDSIGLLLWGDLIAFDAESRAGIKELQSFIRARRNHPSIGAWLAPTGDSSQLPVPPDELIAPMRAVDPSRLILGRGPALRRTRQSAWLCRPYRTEIQPWADFEPRLPAPFDHDAALYCGYLGDESRINTVFFAASTPEASLDSPNAAFEAGFRERELDRLFSTPEAMAADAQALYSDMLRDQCLYARNNLQLVGLCQEMAVHGEPLSPESNLLEGLKAGLPTLRPVIHMPQTNLVPRQEVEVSVDMINEPRLDHRIDLSLQVVGPTNQVLWKKKRGARISKNGREIWSGAIAASGSTGDHLFIVRLMQGMKVLAEGNVPFHVFAPAEPVEFPISLTDPEGEWRDRCNPLVRISKRRTDVYVVPPMGNTIRAYPPEELAQLLAEVAEGAVGIVFNPPDDWNDLAMMVDPAIRATSLEIGGQTPPAQHYAKLHPVFEGLPSRGLMGDVYSGVMPTRTFLETSDEDICGVFAPVGYVESDRPGRHEDTASWDGWGSNILVRRLGGGRLVFVHLRIFEHLGSDPVADRLFVNLLNHFVRRAVPSEEPPMADRPIRDWLRRERTERTRRWMVLGMFPNDEGDGHNTPFPPEDQVVLEQPHIGWFRAISWTPWFSVADNQHTIDLNHAVSPWGFSGPSWDPGVAYAYAEFSSPHRGAVTLELILQEATKVWLNGRLVFEEASSRPLGRPETVHCAAYLRQGKNTVLVKASKESGTCRFGLDLLSTDQDPLPITWWR